jgi:glucan biosynthesis protein
MPWESEEGAPFEASMLRRLVVFLGAGDFRAVAKGQIPGKSARGLSIDTADQARKHADDFKNRP